MPEPFTDGLGPMARWERDCAAPETEGVLLQRVAEGEPLKAVCRSRGWPYALVAQWLHGDENLLARYDAALRIWVDSIAMETVAISDEQVEVVTESGQVLDPNVARDALRIKSRQWAAEKLHRARYGQTLKVEKSVSVTADSGLVGFAGALLERVRALPGKVDPVNFEPGYIAMSTDAPEPEFVRERVLNVKPVAATATGSTSQEI